MSYYQKDKFNKNQNQNSLQLFNQLNLKSIYISPQK